ncbi:MAG: maltose ABC transporter substrate-binding protein [Dermatophilus congolensis]|nr:maltose ABC transporter substrate-binding protein [Dermatophilus congolensis]
MTKRALSVAAAASATAMFLAACGGGQPSSTGTSADAGAATPAETPAAVSTESPERDGAADLVIWSDGDRAPALAEYGKKFGEENGVKVAVQVATETRQQFKDATKVGKGPDVVVGAHDWVGELVQNGTVAPVQLDAATSAKFLPDAAKAAQFDGQNYGVPYAVENLGLIRNTDLAPEAPKTLDELVATGNQLVKDGKTKQVLVQNIGKKGNAYFTFPYFSAFGGNIFAAKANGDFDATKLVVNSPENVKAGELIAKLGKDKVLSTNMDDTNMDAIFDAGDAPYLISGPWSIAPAKKAGINYAISPMPSVAGGQAMKPFLGVQMFYVSAKAKNAAMAQEFVTNYVPRKDLQMALFEAGQRPPALKEAYDEVAASNPDMKAWFEAGQGGPLMPNIPAMNAVWEPFGIATADIISGKAAPKARLDAAQKEIEANIAKG